MVLDNSLDVSVSQTCLEIEIAVNAACQGAGGSIPGRQSATDHISLQNHEICDFRVCVLRSRPGRCTQWQKLCLRRVATTSRDSKLTFSMQSAGVGTAASSGCSILESGILGFS